jgi:hypothetical protein
MQGKREKGRTASRAAKNALRLSPSVIWLLPYQLLRRHGRERRRSVSRKKVRRRCGEEGKEERCREVGGSGGAAHKIKDRTKY